MLSHRPFEKSENIWLETVGVFYRRSVDITLFLKVCVECSSVQENSL